ncbi:hypothetical protein BDN72DRAFT_903341 [Pluteus cervinus]|uniref:Uncharacterized protein n=1 Tax=Pluteus cervinus TaxID=181527 RepID=A0ACD3A9A3_9AGAR|nr:hypothetical protein BDN72DRAFT_903341 [Pluteus cervinus]
MIHSLVIRMQRFRGIVVSNDSNKNGERSPELVVEAPPSENSSLPLGTIILRPPQHVQRYNTTSFRRPQHISFAHGLLLAVFLFTVLLLFISKSIFAEVPPSPAFLDSIPTPPPSSPETTSAKYYFSRGDGFIIDAIIMDNIIFDDIIFDD